MLPYTELSLTAQTAYLQLLQSALAAAHARTVADLPGSFAAKTVKGRRYWYYQFTQPSGKDRKSTRLNSSHSSVFRMPSSA